MTKIFKKMTEGYKAVENAVVNGYKRIEDIVVDSYKKIETGAVEGFTKVTDKCMEALFAREGETVEQARERLSSPFPFDV